MSQEPKWLLKTNTIEQPLLDTNAGKQLSSAATDVKLTLMLKNLTPFRYRKELLPPDVSK